MPSIVLAIGKMIGIVLMMHLQSALLRIALGVFLIVYSVTQLLDIKAMRIKGTPLQAAVFCGLGGFFGGVFNVSGPAAAIYCQARYGHDPKRYAANMNCIFAPSAIVALAMHIWYGNFNADAVVGSASMVVAVLISTVAGVSVLKKINAKNMRKLSYIYIIIMGAVICISG